MRVNVYAEEITQRIEIVEKDGHTGIRFYLELPVTMPSASGGVDQVSGPFEHHPGDDDSSAVTFWGKKDIRECFVKAIEELDKWHLRKREEQATAAAYAERERQWAQSRGLSREEFGLSSYPSNPHSIQSINRK